MSHMKLCLALGLVGIYSVAASMVIDKDRIISYSYRIFIANISIGKWGPVLSLLW